MTNEHMRSSATSLSHQGKADEKHKWLLSYLPEKLTWKHWKISSLWSGQQPGLSRESVNWNNHLEPVWQNLCISSVPYDWHFTVTNRLKRKVDRGLPKALFLMAQTQKLPKCSAAAKPVNKWKYIHHCNSRMKNPRVRGYSLQMPETVHLVWFHSCEVRRTIRQIYRLEVQCGYIGREEWGGCRIPRHAYFVNIHQAGHLGVLFYGYIIF